MAKDDNIRTVTISSGKRELVLYVVAGEHSGDALGAKLMQRLNEDARGRVRYLGVGGALMQQHGLVSQFPIADVAVMGPLSILARLPRLINRVNRTADSAVSAQPDALIIIDSPEFTHPIAKRFRRRMPATPIINYVSPSIWAWRPGRARKMRRYVDHVLALLPFEPAAHERLGGPPCTYVGHPLIEKLPWIRALDATPLTERLNAAPGQPVLVVLPGSRRSEVAKLMGPFGDAIAALRAEGITPVVVVPVVEHVRDLIEQATATWAVEPHFVTTEDDKFRAFKIADAALAASGTVTLELALAGTPMVVAYRLDSVAWSLRFLMKARSIVLANLVLEENAFPELLQHDVNGQKLAATILPLLRDTPERRAQLAALERIPEKMQLHGASPSEIAARIVLSLADSGRERP
jgi:lipid-A-disaccharide synthase